MPKVGKSPKLLSAGKSPKLSSRKNSGKLSKKSPKLPAKSPILTSSFDQQTFLPPQLQLDESTSVAAQNSLQHVKGERDRYQLFVNEANSYSHIITLFIALKGLEEVVYVNVVRHDDAEHMEDRGCPDSNIQITKLRIRDLAMMMKNLFESESFPIPLLYDTKQHKILSTDSAEICSFLNSGFGDLALNCDLDLCPPDKRMKKKLKRVEKRVLGKINKCIGKAGRASSKEEFESAGKKLHEGLTEMNSILHSSRYLCGDYITEADVLEFVPLFRFDPLISWSLLKDGKRVLIKDEYPNIWNWLKDIYQQHGVADTCDIIEILNSKGFRQSFGARLVELDIEFEMNWDLMYAEELGTPHDRGERFPHKEEDYGDEDYEDYGDNNDHDNGDQEPGLKRKTAA